MVHAARAWVQQSRDDSCTVLLQKDIRHAFNEVRPSEFLKDCRNHAPASARFAHYVYGMNSHLVYADHLHACQRGQQGCPMMGPMFCLTRRRMFEAARNQTSRPAPEFEVEFAYSGGKVSDVLATFKAEIALAETFRLKFDYSKCTLHLLAGEQFRGDVSEFQALGIRIVTGCDLAVLKTPVAGTSDFLACFMKDKQRELQEIAAAVQQLPRKHVAFHILQQSLSFGRVQYWHALRHELSQPLFLSSIPIFRKMFSKLCWSNPCPQGNGCKLACPSNGGVGILSDRHEMGMRVFHVADLAYVTAGAKVMLISRVCCLRMLPLPQRWRCKPLNICQSSILPSLICFQIPVGSSTRLTCCRPCTQLCMRTSSKEVRPTGTHSGGCCAGSGSLASWPPSPTRDLVFACVVLKHEDAFSVVSCSGLGCFLGCLIQIQHTHTNRDRLLASRSCGVPCDSLRHSGLARCLQLCNSRLSGMDALCQAIVIGAGRWTLSHLPAWMLYDKRRSGNETVGARRV